MLDLGSLVTTSWQDLVQLYMRAVQRGAVAAGGGSGVKDVSKMTPAERKKEIARRRAEAQKEKVHTTVRNMSTCCRKEKEPLRTK